MITAETKKLASDPQKIILSQLFYFWSIRATCSVGALIEIFPVVENH